MKKIILFVGLGLSTMNCYAQLAARWQQIYGGSSVEVSYGVRSCPDSGYVSVGSSSSAGPTDGYIFKTDTLGVVQWSKFYGGINIDIMRAVEILPDSGFIVAGFTNSYGSGGYDGWLLRMDKNGDTLWSRTCGTSNWDFFYDVEYTRDSGFLCAGGTYGIGNGDEDMYLVKFDKNGDTIWTRTYGGLKQDEARGIIETEDSLLAICGFTYSLADTLGESWLLRLDSLGNILWTRTLGDSTVEDRASALHYDPVGDLIIYCGYSMATGNGDAYWSGVYYNNTDWIRVDHTGSDFEEYTAIRVKPGLSAIATNGITYTYGGGSGDMLFFGSPSWYFASFGTIEEDMGYGIDFAYDGGYILCGQTVGYNSIVPNAYLIKIDTAYQPAATVDVIDFNSNAEVICYPNPAKDVLFVEINSLTEFTEPWTVAVYDLSGRLISTSASTITSTADKTKLSISTSELTDGMYFLSIAQGEETVASTKFIISQ